MISRRKCLGLLASSAALAVGCERVAPQSLRVGIISWPGYTPLHVADELNYFDPKAPVKLIDYSSSTQVLRAFRNSSIEVACLTLDETLLLAEDLPDVRIIMAVDFSVGADALMSIPTLQSLDNLRGKRVGYEATALGAYMLARALEKAGLSAADVRLVTLQLDEHERAMTNVTVDAVVTFEPNRGRLLSRGARVLFSSREIPGEIVDVVVARPQALQDYPGAGVSLLRGWFKALDYIKSSPADANQRLGNWLRLSVDQTKEAYQLLDLVDLGQNRSLILGNSPPLRLTVGRLGKVMMGRQLLSRPVALDSLIDSTVLEHLAS